MALALTALEDTMIGAARGLVGTAAQQAEQFLIPELKKIAVQITAIETNIVDYTEAGARALFDMQIQASVGVIVAMTTLVLLDVQTLINTILASVKDVVNKALGFGLLA